MNNRKAAMDTLDAASFSVGCFGCAWSVLGLVLLVFILTHLSEIFAKLASVLK